MKRAVKTDLKQTSRETKLLEHLAKGAKPDRLVLNVVRECAYTPFQLGNGTFLQRDSPIPTSLASVAEWFLRLARLRLNSSNLAFSHLPL